jgi:hypothetical protein
MKAAAATAATPPITSPAPIFLETIPAGKQVTQNAIKAASPTTTTPASATTKLTNFSTTAIGRPAAALSNATNVVYKSAGNTATISAIPATVPACQAPAQTANNATRSMSELI